MGKILRSILTIGAAIAVNLIPGAQGWLSGLIVNAGLGAGLSVGAGIAVASALTTVVTVAGLASLAGLLGLGPQAPRPETSEGPLKTSIPPRVSAYGESAMFGAYCLYTTATDGTAVDVFAFHDGPIDSIVQRYLGDDPVSVTGTVVNAGTDGRYKDSAVNIYTTLGATPGTAAFAALQSLLPGIWTSDHRGDGVVIGATTFKSVKAKDFQETYPAGLPPPLRLAAKWQLCYDWRKDSTEGGSGSHRVNNPATWEWTDNPVLHLAHYLMVRAGRSWTLHFQPTRAWWEDAADDCDTTIALAAGGTEKRYRSCVAHKHTDPHRDVIGSITATFDGWLATRNDGALVVYSGRYYTPTVSIGPDEIVSYSWETGIPDEDAINEIIPTYVSSAHKYNTVEADPWTDDADISARGRKNSTTLNIQAPSHGQSRRLAKRQMLREMAQSRGTVTTNAYGRVARGERYINLRIEDAGTVFYDGVAEVVALTVNLATAGITFQWVSASDAIDDWDEDTEEGSPAAEGDEPAPATLDTPVITDINLISQSATQVRLEIIVDAPDRTDLTWFMRWRQDGETVWGPEAEYPDSAAGSSVTLLSEVLLINQTVEVQVQYQTGDGRLSAWSTIYEINTSTGGVPPGSPTNVSATGGTGEATVDWRNPTSSDFDYTIIWGSTTNDFGTASTLTGPQEGAAGAFDSILITSLSAGTWYFWAVAYNASATPSTESSVASATVT